MFFYIEVIVCITTIRIVIVVNTSFSINYHEKYKMQMSPIAAVQTMRALLYVQTTIQT